MNKVLRCTMLSALFVTGLVASVLAAPYQPPTAVSTPAVDQAVLAGYSVLFMVQMYVLPSMKTAL